MKRSIDYADYDPEDVDVLDEEGKLTGETAEKFLVHEKGLWHKAVHVWIVNDRGEVLLQKRSERMDIYPLAWDLSVGAHITAGDTPLETAVRETKEELGIELPENEFTFLFLLKNQDDLPNGLYNNEYNDVYLVHLPKGILPTVADTKEVTAVQFFTLDEFENMIAMDRSVFAPPRAECRQILAMLRKEFQK